MTQTKPTIQTTLTVAIDRLVPNPLNPRSRLGDLAELTRSINAHGVLQPLLVLTADNDGRHVIVAGHRRHAAATAAGVEALAVVVRDLTEVEQIEVALSENSNRDGLDIADEIAAIERLMGLDDTLTPTKLSRRIGKSQAWVRDRMAVTILPSRWRAEISKGTLALTAAVAAATVAELGTEHLDTVCASLAELSGRGATRSRPWRTTDGTCAAPPPTRPPSRSVSATASCSTTPTPCPRQPSASTRSA